MNGFTGLSLFLEVRASMPGVSGVEIEPLRRIPLFKTLDEEALATLAERARIRHYDPRDAIVEQDVPASAVYIIDRGRAAVSVMARDGRAVTIRELGPGEIIGEVSLLDGGPPSATVTAITRTALIAIDRASFRDLLQQRPRIAVDLLPLLASRLRRLTAWADDLAGLPLPARLAKCLLGIVSEHGQQVGPKRIRIGQKLSQQDLARRLGVTRESVNKHIRRLERNGILEQENGYLVITDIARLQGETRVD
jgi:CRP/FNR family transcriptional regulator, cyclic AMP receptor protein